MNRLIKTKQLWFWLLMMILKGIRAIHLPKNHLLNLDRKDQILWSNQKSCNKRCHPVHQYPLQLKILKTTINLLLWLRFSTPSQKVICKNSLLKSSKDFKKGLKLNKISLSNKKNNQKQNKSSQNLEKILWSAKK